MDLRDRFRGCLLGGAAGDALGMPVEGYSAEQIQILFGRIEDMLSPSRGIFMPATGPASSPMIRKRL